MDKSNDIAAPHRPWNKGHLVGQKPPLKLKEIWSIRIRLQIANKVRELAMFNIAIDSKLRACDLVSLRVDDVFLGGHARVRAMVMPRKTGRPVQFEITEPTRESPHFDLPPPTMTSGRLRTFARKSCGLAQPRSRPTTWPGGCPAAWEYAA